MTALEELKSSTRQSLETKQRALEQLLADAKIEADESRKELRDALLDIVGSIRATYELTVAEARDYEKSVDDVAALWKETHTFYSDWLKWWELRRGS
jgi:hypothetical protein